MILDREISAPNMTVTPPAFNALFGLSRRSFAQVSASEMVILMELEGLGLVRSWATGMATGLAWQITEDGKKFMESQL